MKDANDGCKNGHEHCICPDACCTSEHVLLKVTFYIGMAIPSVLGWAGAASLTVAWAFLLWASENASIPFWRFGYWSSRCFLWRPWCIMHENNENHESSPLFQSLSGVIEVFHVAVLVLIGWKTPKVGRNVSPGLPIMPTLSSPCLLSLH